MLEEAKLNNIFKILQEADPQPKTELDYVNDFTLLVAIVLSAQSTDVQVNKVTKELFKVANNPQAILDLGVEGLKAYIKSLGLFNSKANNIIKLSQILVGKEIPKTIDELEKLPGVGGKTARVFLNCAYNIPVIAVDTHVFRVSKRLGIAKGKDAKQVQDELNKIVPKEWLIHAHHWLILHGRYVCKARKPICENCKLSNLCSFFN